MKKIFICFSLFLISCSTPYDYLVVDSESNYGKNTFNYGLKFGFKQNGISSITINIELPKGTLKVGDTLFSIDRGVVCESQN